MKTTQDNPYFQQRILALIEEILGTKNFVMVPTPVIKLCDNDLPTAIMLSNLIYWCDRGSSKDGWIWKPYREWKQEIGLNRYQVDKATKWLKERGYLETTKRKARGNPTIHYKLNQIEVLHAVGVIAEQGK